VGITQTPRLHLQKQTAGDPDWHTALDAGFDNADARLLQISSDHGGAPNPNTGGAAPGVGHFVGQIYIDETVDPPRVWSCTVAADPASVWDLLSSDGIELSSAVSTETILQDCLEALQTRIVTLEDVIPPPPRGMIDGCAISYDTGGNYLGIDVGECADSSKTRYLERSAKWTKDRASWVAGNGNGAVSSSVWTADGSDIVVDKWYHVFLMWASGFGHDVGFDDDVTGANLIADHSATYVRRIGSWLADSSKLVRRFNQFGDYFLWYDPSKDNLFYDGANIVNDAITTVTVVTPLDVLCLAQLNWDMYDPTDRLLLYARSPYAMDQVPEALKGLAQIFSDNTYGVNGASAGFFLTNLLSQVKYQASCTSSPIDKVLCATLGYFDPRGKDL